MKSRSDKVYRREVLSVPMVPHLPYVGIFRRLVTHSLPLRLLIQGSGVCFDHGWQSLEDTGTTVDDDPSIQCGYDWGSWFLQDGARLLQNATAGIIVCTEFWLSRQEAAQGPSVSNPWTVFTLNWCHGVPAARGSSWGRAVRLSKLSEFCNPNRLQLSHWPFKASALLYVKRQISAVTGLEWPWGFQEVKVHRSHDNGTGWW